MGVGWLLYILEVGEICKGRVSVRDFFERAPNQEPSDNCHGILGVRGVWVE